MENVDLGQKRPATFTIKIWDKLLVVIVEVDIGPRPSTLTTITQVTMVNCCVYLVLIAMWMILFMKMKEVIVWGKVKYVEVGHPKIFP